MESGSAGSSSDPLSLSQLISRAFALASSPASASSEEPTSLALTLLARADDLSQTLGVISPNEPLKDISTPSLRVLLIPSLRGELETRVRTATPHERKARLESSKAQHSRFLSSLQNYSILPPSTLSLISAGSTQANLRDSTDAARRRETKIALFKLERSLQNALDDYRSRARDRAGGSGKARIPSLGVGSSGADQGQDAPGEAYYDLLILSRGTSGGAAGVNSAVAEDSDEEDNNETRVSATFGAAGGDGSSVGQPASLRQYLLLLLNLHGLRAASSLQSCRMELELLRSMPASAEADAREREGQEREEIARRERARAGAGGAEADWRLDGGSWGARADGALMDARGRPLRPFTITSSSAPGPAAGSDSLTGAATITQLNARQRVREEVFRAGHRLPTMSIDDFLEEEERRGNIITGGGAKGAARATPREARARTAEDDGTLAAEEAEEIARREAIEWDEFKEANPRGAGNTMNRG